MFHRIPAIWHKWFERKDAKQSMFRLTRPDVAAPSSVWPSYARLIHNPNLALSPSFQVRLPRLQKALSHRLEMNHPWV